MKKFSKLFLSCAAVAAVTAAVATSAMAAGEVSATYTLNSRWCYNSKPKDHNKLHS